MNFQFILHGYLQVEKTNTQEFQLSNVGDLLASDALSG